MVAQEFPRGIEQAGHIRDEFEDALARGIAASTAEIDPVHLATVYEFRQPAQPADESGTPVSMPGRFEHVVDGEVNKGELRHRQNMRLLGRVARSARQGRSTR